MIKMKPQDASNQLDQLVFNSISESCRHGVMATPFALFCKQNGIEEAVGNKIVDAMLRYTQSPANAVKKREIPNVGPRFSRAQAIAVVRDAFHTFSPQMAELVQAADHEGRIFFDPSDITCQSVVHSLLPSPEGARDLPQEFKGKACVNVPLRKETLSHFDIMAVAHELGHLAAHDQNIHAGSFSSANRPASEAYALMGEFLVHDHFLQNSSFREHYGAVNEFEMFRSMRTNIDSASYANIINMLCAKKLDQMAGTDTGYDEFIESLATSGKAAQILKQGDLFAPVSYPLGLAGALQAFSKYKNGDETVARKWNNAAYRRLNLGQIMEAIGVDFTHPKVADDLIAAHRAEKRNFLKAVIQSRGTSLQIGRQLEERIGQREDFAMIPCATKVGSIVSTAALLERNLQR